METVKRDDLLDALIDACMPPPREEGDFTLEEFIERCNATGRELSRVQAGKQLSRLVEEGQLEKRQAWEGQQIDVWRVK